MAFANPDHQRAVEMLQRIIALSQGVVGDTGKTSYPPLETMDGFGVLSDAGTLAGVDGVELVSGQIGPDIRPGLYESGKQKLARNVLSEESVLSPVVWPSDVPIRGQEVTTETPLGGLLLSLALILLTIDVIASLALSGRLGLAKATAAALAAMLLVPEAQAQAESLALLVLSDPIHREMALLDAMAADRL